MKFLADMGISPRVVEELRQKQHLFNIINQQAEALSKDAICSVTERKVRIRMLPL